MANILVTDGAGFTGSYIVEELIACGHAVRVLDGLVEQVHRLNVTRSSYQHPSAEFMRGDVRDAATLRRALDGVEVVFHEAAEVGVGQSPTVRSASYADWHLRRQTVIPYVHLCCF